MRALRLTADESQMRRGGSRRAGSNPPPRLRGISELPHPNAAVTSDQLLVLGLMARRCDLRCRYCYTAAGRERPGELTTSIRVDLIQQGAQLGVRSLWIPGEGEPLLDESFWPMVETAAGAGLRILFYTSGTQVTRDVAQRLSDLPCSVVLKLNSLQPCVQDDFTGVPASYAALRRGLDYLLDTGMATERRLAAETVVVPQNRDELPQILRFCRQRGIIPYIERLLATGRGRHPNLQMDLSQEDVVFADLARIDHEEFGYFWEPTGMFAGGIWYCDRILYTLVVDAVGAVYPCVTPTQKLGDIRAQTLKDIWHGCGARGLRNTLSADVDRGACFCRRFLESGSLFAQPECSHDDRRFGRLKQSARMCDCVGDMHDCTIA